MTTMNNTKFFKGIHILADLWECDSSKLNFIKEVKQVLQKAVKKGKLTALNDYFFQFNPSGVTGVYVLSQSHISIHTWPEKNFASIDIFTCGPPENALKAFEAVCEELKPKRIQKKLLERMDEGKNIETIKTRNTIFVKKTK